MTKARMLLGLLLLPFGASSMDSYENLTVGLMLHDRPPYFYRENDEVKGAYIDILDEIASKNGLHLDYKFLPQARIRHYLKSQFISIEPGIDILWRQEQGEPEASVYTDVFYQSHEVIAYNPKQLHKQDLTPKDFDALRPCSVLGFNLPDTDGFENDNMKTMSESQIISLLKVGRCDFAVFPEDVIEPLISNGTLSKTEIVATYNLRFRLAKKHENLLPLFNLAIKDMVKNEKIKEIMLKHQR